MNLLIHYIRNIVVMIAAMRRMGQRLNPILGYVDDIMIMYIYIVVMVTAFVQL